MADNKKKAQPTKAQQARAQQQQAQSKRGQLRAQQAAIAARAKRNRIIGVVVAVVVLAAILVGLVVWQTSSNDKPAGNTSSAASFTGFKPPNGSANATYIEVKAANASADAIIVDEYFDYQCPYCRLVDSYYGSLFRELVDRGDVVLHMHPRSFLDRGIPGNYSIKAATAAACADTVGKFIEYHETVFANQPAKEGDGYTEQQLRVDFPAEAGITGDNLTSFQQCYDTQKTTAYMEALEANQVMPASSGITDRTKWGTPDFYAYDQAKHFTTNDLLNGHKGTDGKASYSPKMTTADELLTFLKGL
ncbi:MAG: thioredoxin domain-containing protein [Propionibacteriaceae bacterium]|jgi:protein-disulfide isomerase|nr:thioredoxin domain-containing protein [Propionibacteriaceae bacterium]